MHKLTSFFFLFSLIFFISCGSDGEKKSIPKVAALDTPVKLQRFEKEFFALDSTRLREGFAGLKQKYPLFYEVFSQQIIQNPNAPIPEEEALEDFYRYPRMHFLNDTVQKVYGDLGWLEKDLNQMFALRKYYLPQKPVPQVVTMISEFATEAFTYGDSVCGIGLDMFLGADFPGYDPNNFPAYIRRQFMAEYIPVRLAKAIAQEDAGVLRGDRLLDMMIHNGKILYYVDKILPEVADSLKMGYTAEQMQGCYENEPNVWARILEQNLLYTTEGEKIAKLVMPSPNAPMIFTEAPGQIANWVGWRIVDAYMRRNPKTTLQELFDMKDAQVLLEQAKYKPAR